VGRNLVNRKHKVVLKFIEIYQDENGMYSPMSGGCYKFHLWLQERLSNAYWVNSEGYYNSDHVITKVGERYYDINGEVTDTEGYLPFSHFGEENIREQFKEHLDAEER
jgi:hypothetical protein